MLDVLKLASAIGGSAGAAVGLPLFWIVPDLCEPRSLSPATPGPLASLTGAPTLVYGYDCFELGVYPLSEWALGLGGIAALTASLATAMYRSRNQS